MLVFAWIREFLVNDPFVMLIVQNSLISSAASAASPSDDGAALAAEPLAAECSIDDFAKVDLRVARVINAEHIPEANKLLGRSYREPYSL